MSKVARAAKNKMKRREAFCIYFLWRVFMAITQCPAAVIKVENACNFYDTASERETWQVLPRNSGSNSNRNSRKAQHVNCNQQQCFLLLSLPLLIATPLFMGVAHIEHALHLFIHQFVCVCTFNCRPRSVCAMYIDNAYAALALSHVLLLYK